MLRRRRSRCPAAAGLALLLAAACAPELVQLEPQGAMPLAPAGQPLEVMVSLAGGADPMPVRGSPIEYAGMVDSVRRFVAAAAYPWAERHRNARPGGWQMLVEIVRSDARWGDGQLAVELEARVTLRGTAGPVHLGQTRGYCQLSAPPDGDGSAVVYQCLERMSRDLLGWLQGIDP